MNIFLALAYIKYKTKAHYRKGHGVHPPFAFDLVRNLFYEKNRYYFYDTIDEQRNEFLKNKDKIEIVDYGAGSKHFHSNIRRISKLVEYNTTSQIQGELIARLVVQFKPKNIIELGTSLGLGTMYLALPDSRSQIYTVEGCESLVKYAHSSFQKNKIRNVKVIHGIFKEVLPSLLNKISVIDMVYFDGHHTYEATKEYFKMCLPYASKGAFFIFDDIHWSSEMDRIWNEIISNPQVSVSFDLFHFGIAILNKKVEKQHYIVNWP